MKNTQHKHVFVSYSRTDIETAKRLVDDLARSGYSCWFDIDDLLGGENWKYKIKQAIESCPFFICILSERSQKTKGFRHSEIRQALEIAKEIPPDKVYIIPIKIEKCDVVYSELDNINILDLSKDWSNGVKIICRTIKYYLNEKEISSDLLTFITSVYKKCFFDINQSSEINYFYQKACQAYDLIYDKNCELGNWDTKRGLDHTLVYYIAEYIKENVANENIASLRISEIAEGITNQIIEYLNSEYNRKLSEIYRSSFSSVRRESDLLYIYQQAGKAYDYILDENIKQNFWNASKGVDHKAVYYMAEWIKNNISNKNTSELTVLEIADGITSLIYAYLNSLNRPESIFDSLQ